MRESRWDRLYGMVAEKFGVEQEYSREIEVSRGVKGKQETIVFSTPKGIMKLEKTVKPKVEKVKYHYSRKTYRGAYQELQYSHTETVETIKLYQWNKRINNWEEVNLDRL